MKLVLGVDTSNYTTSLTAVSFASGELVAEARKLLPVKLGERGLRQSDALFFHVHQLPVVMNELMGQLATVYSTVEWSGVGVSVRPRPQASSYMPVFHAGWSFAQMFTRALSIPLVPTSHQEGHVAAAEYFLDLPMDIPRFGVHISGGTSDVLLAKPTRFGYAIEWIGEGADLHAGQFVDRVGVALGMPFPAGPHLEKLAEDFHFAEQSDKDSPTMSFQLSATVKGANMSFSGPCSAALRAIDGGVPPAQVAAAVEQCIANSVVKAVSHASHANPTVTYCVIAGGVASNARIKARVIHRLKRVCPDLKAHFAPSRYSSDNALGPAVIGRRHIVSEPVELW